MYIHTIVSLEFKQIVGTESSSSSAGMNLPTVEPQVQQWCEWVQAYFKQTLVFVPLFVLVI